jgi:alkylation response protein AidB-like acyl-CoA dehydrogenase
VWDVPIGAHQAIAHPLARALISVEAASLLLLRATDLFEEGRDCGAAANMAKFAASEAAMEALDAAIQTHGGNGMSDEYGLADLWGITRLYGIAPVTREMTLNHLAVHELGLPKSY